MTFMVNTMILALVLGLMIFFYAIEAKILVWFSIPTICIYLVGYFLVYKDRLDIYVWMVYLWITLYMCLTTICLGYSFGFHMYCLSMIPIMFVSEYIAYELGRKSLNAKPVCIGIAVLYLLCTGYVSYSGPVYQRDKGIASFFWVFNAVIVFGFLIVYANWMVKRVIQSEESLKHMAHNDRLTGLHNRHFMIDKLESLVDNANAYYLAMADIDHFKNINDTYGHNAGDYVLKHLAELMEEKCPDCVLSRWGGEEFLLLYREESKKDDSDDLSRARAYFEDVRTSIENSKFFFEDHDIKVTLTIGIAKWEAGQSIDKWVDSADDKLYIGKNSGRNKVVI